MQPVEREDILDHAVDVNRQWRELLAADGAAQNKDHLLGPAQGKGGNQYFAPVFRNLGNDFDQTLLFHLAVGVQPLTVGRFQDQDVGTQAGEADAGDGPLRGDRYVPAVEQCALFAGQIHASRPQDMAGLVQGKRDFPVVERAEGILKGVDPDPFHHLLYMPLGVSRDLVFTVHDFEAVVEEDSDNVPSSWGHKDRGPGKLPADHRQAAAVVHMGVADHDGVDPAQLLGQAEIGQPVPAPEPYPAVEQEIAPLHLQEQAAGPDFLAAAAKTDFHSTLVESNI